MNKLFAAALLVSATFAVKLTQEADRTFTDAEIDAFVEEMDFN